MNNVPTRVPLPEGTIISCEIVITSYFDKDGQLKYAVNLDGEPNFAQAIGLCELAKVEMHKMYKANEPYSPDEIEEEDDSDE